MNQATSQSLLGDEDPPPVQVINPDGASPFLLIGDHAGNAIPASLGDMGLEAEERRRHIAWDIGIAGLGDRLARLVDATFIRQTYSRLVIDCNRDPAAKDSIAETSDGTRIPANAALDDGARAARIAQIHAPYQQAIADALARRDAAGRSTILVALHSFTPRFAGFERPWHAGILHDRGDPAFALEMLRTLAAEPDLAVGDNEPYRMDSIDYTVPRQAYPARRPYVELEIRQDLIADAAGESEWAGRIAAALRAARASLG
jgi:predicted N-formylglutamate amidohydrolase